MANNLSVNNAIVQDEVLKATSLIYLKDALYKEEYENCAEFIRSAKSFGAQQSEVKEVISGYIADYWKRG